jgi:hypothetical protein
MAEMRHSRSRVVDRAGKTSAPLFNDLAMANRPKPAMDFCGVPDMLANPMPHPFRQFRSFTRILVGIGFIAAVIGGVLRLW